jgi:GNAT superfamily N-acetyltransferase
VTTTSYELVRRIESASAATLEAIAGVLAQRGYDSFTTSRMGGFALCIEQGSALNKLVGLGFQPLDLPALASFEERAAVRGCRLQVELATYADPASARLLLARGYVLDRYQNVLVRERRVEPPPVLPPGLEVRAPEDGELGTFMDVVATGFAHSDDPENRDAENDGVANDRALVDITESRVVEPWLALRDGEPAGGANLRIQAGVALFFGATTLPRHRRRGVQQALLQTRLQEAWRRGCDVAVVGTDLGAVSQKNAESAGFTLLYQRAILLKDPT